MPNPFNLDYLTESSPTFGPYDWGIYVIQAILLAIGFYLYFLRKDANVPRRRLMAKVGLVMIAIGSIGTLFGMLRMREAGVFAQRYWFYLLLLVELVGGAWLFFYVRKSFSRLSSRNTSSQGQKRTASRAQPSGKNTEGAANDTPSAARSRRDSRRERKRKKR